MSGLNAGYHSEKGRSSTSRFSARGVGAMEKIGAVAYGPPLARKRIRLPSGNQAGWLELYAPSARSRPNVNLVSSRPKRSIRHTSNPVVAGLDRYTMDRPSGDQSDCAS